MNARTDILPPPVLTRGQRQLLEHVMRGLTGEEIADAVGIHRVSVEQGLMRARERLAARNAAHAVAIALGLGLLDPGPVLAAREAAIRLGLAPAKRGRR